MELLAILREWVPTGTETQAGTATAAVGTTAAYFLGWNEATEALLVLMVIDYITGMLAAYISAEKKLDSRRGFKGICKKLVTLLLVALANELERASGISGLLMVVTWFFIGNEGLSVIENAAKAGVPIPQKLRDTLEQLQSEKDTRKGDDNHESIH